jgi:phenylpropionate dioxygenase-like ring-hydroxylating dioxygenase large terminal subunit
MANTNGGSADIRQVPDTFKLTDWPRNCWYAAAYDVELQHRLLPRTIAGRNLIMFRREDGRPRRS